MTDPNVLNEVQTVLVGFVMYWCIGRIVHWFVGRGDTAKRVHGKYIPEWIAGTYLGTGLLVLFWNGPSPNVPAPPSLTIAHFAILIGLAIGWVHGSIRLRRHQARDQEPITRDRKATLSPRNLEPDDGNPYRPP